MLDFNDYLLKFYIAEDSIYPIDMWSDVGEGVTKTNTCKSFHRGLEYQFLHAHPNMWELLMGLHSEQQKAELKMRTNKKLYVKQNTRQVQEDKKVLWESYLNELITQYDFVKAICFKLSPVQIL